MTKTRWGPLEKDDLRIDVEHGWKRKRNGLARAGLGDGDDVVTAECHGPGLALDGGRVGEALGADCAHDVLGEPNLVEGGDGAWDVAALDLHLLGATELLDLAVGAAGDALVLDVEVFFKVGELLSAPVDRAETTAEVAHAVATTTTVSAAPSTAVAATTVAAAAVATTVATAATSTAVSTTVALQKG